MKLRLCSSNEVITGIFAGNLKTYRDEFGDFSYIVGDQFYNKNGQPEDTSNSCEVSANLNENG